MTMLPSEKDGLPVVLFADGRAFVRWLATEAGSRPGAWLMFAKKGADVASLSRQQAIDAALCRGWIDGQTAAWDDLFFLVRFTPRRPRSKWSQVNRSRAEQLIDQGLMHTRGLKEVEAAQADGRWAAAYPPSSTAAIPADLQAALDSHPDAAARFAAMNRTARYEVLLGLANVRKAETRARRIAVFVAGSELMPTTTTSERLPDPVGERRLRLTTGVGSRPPRPIGEQL